MQDELAKMDTYNVWNVVDRNSIPNIWTVWSVGYQPTSHTLETPLLL
jgi:hypothetical protein